MMKQLSYNVGMNLARLAGELNDRDWNLTRLMNEAQVYRPRLSWRTVSEVASGKRAATPGIVQAFAKALGVGVDFLQGTSDEPSRLEPQSDADIPMLVADLAPLVDHLKELTPDERRPLLAIFESILSYGAGSQRSAGAGIPDKENLFRVLNSMPLQEFDLFLEEFEDLVQRRREKRGAAQA